MDEISGMLSDDLFDHEPTIEEKMEMRKASKPPSEWLKLLCQDWAMENMDIAENADLKFLSYKSYLKGKLSSQLLCRLSIPEMVNDVNMNTSSIEFWKILGIQDEFDIRHIISQVEKFCSSYSIRSTFVDGDLLDDTALDATNAAVAASLTVSPLHNFLDMDKAFPPRREPRRLPISGRKENDLDGEGKKQESTSKEVTREEKRQRKLLQRRQREQYALEQKDAALRRAAELVRSNRIPIEITRGASVAKSVRKAVNIPEEEENVTKKKNRSDIVVSIASDLDQIVTHAKNLFYKYNAIAKEHNKKISWAMISKELGIHVKVREKYARMHARALQRGFDFKKCGYYKIKDHPEIFLEPITKKPRELPVVQETVHVSTPAPESQMPLTTGAINQPVQGESDSSETHILHTTHENVHPTTIHHNDHMAQVHIDHAQTHIHNPNDHEQIPAAVHHDHLPMYSTRDMSQHITDDQVAAAVDAAIKTVPVNQTTDYAAAEVAEVALTAAGSNQFGTTRA